MITHVSHLSLAMNLGHKIVLLVWLVESEDSVMLLLIQALSPASWMQPEPQNLHSWFRNKQSWLAHIIVTCLGKWKESSRYENESYEKLLMLLQSATPHRFSTENINYKLSWGYLSLSYLRNEVNICLICDQETSYWIQSLYLLWTSFWQTLCQGWWIFLFLFHQPCFEIDDTVNKDQRSVLKDQMIWSLMYHWELSTNRYVMLGKLLSFCKPQIPHQNDREKKLHSLW